ncbi:MAG TPA: glycerate kinase [Firmicutes bacterium]|nr:glycerate kinase [Bacillota bacterium]
MKIVVAPDSFKGSLSSLEVANAIAEGLRAAIRGVEVVTVPMADGGEGTVEAMVLATGGRMLEAEVTGPLGDKVRARFGILGDGKTGVVEMAQASGLPLVPPEKRNPMVTTTFGTGELIHACIKAGCRDIILAIGGSATNDGGAGMAQALGAHLLDRDQKEIGFGGGELRRLDRIIVDDMLPEIRRGEVSVVVACDVDNPLTGPRGASAVYGPQKGATPEMVEILDAALAHYAEIIRRDLRKDVNDLPGAGAAGGLGAGLVAFLNASLRPGVEIVIEAVGLDNMVRDADLVITGEGHIDFQTAFGKTPLGVAKVANRHHVPCVAIAGGIGKGVEVLYERGIQAIIGITRKPMPLEEAMTRAEELLRDTAYTVGAIFLAGRKSMEVSRAIDKPGSLPI